MFFFFLHSSFFFLLFSFYAVGNQLLDGIVWGKMMWPCLFFVVFGILGVINVTIKSDIRFIKCERLCFIITLYVLGLSLMITGSSTTNTFFGNLQSHHDAALGVMQSTCLLTSGLIVCLVATLRLFNTCCFHSLPSALYYSNSACSIGATMVGGLILSSQSAMTQMLGRDLAMDCWGVTTVVFIGSILLHSLFKTIVTSPSNSANTSNVKYSNISENGSSNNNKGSSSRNNRSRKSFVSDSGDSGDSDDGDDGDDGVSSSASPSKKKKKSRQEMEMV
jgi:hypothetical protein